MLKRYLSVFMVAAIALMMSVVVSAQDDVTLTVLIHQNPGYPEFIQEFSEAFTEETGINVDVSVVGAGDLATVIQTRLAAEDVDIYFRLNGLEKPVQDFMVGAVEPQWQTQIDAGLVYDMSGAEFLNNYDEATIEAGSYNGGVYHVSVGRTVYSGLYANLALFEEFGVELPTTWEELVAACETFTNEGISCMTTGGADGWPVFVGAYGLHGSLFPDQAAYVEGLWTGEVAYNDEANLVMWERMKTYAQDMLEPGASGIPGDAAPGRFATGAVAMFTGGSWWAGAVDAGEPDFEWVYIPFPGSSNAEDNAGWFGKYDVGFEIAANSPHVEEALQWVAAFSEPENYNDFVNAVSFIPTQPTATLEGTLGESLAVYLDNFRIGFEQYWVSPTGAGQWALPFASFFAPFNEWDDAAALADRAQADLQSGLDAVSDQ